MRRLPSIKSLARVFGDHDAKQARKILEMNRSELEILPASEARINECYCSPTTSDIRMYCLDALCDGSSGVEAIELKDGSYCEYLNLGDPYVETLVRFKGNYRVSSWGDIVERRLHRYHNCGVWYLK